MIDIPIGEDCDMRSAGGCLLETLRLLGSLVICEDELPEPALARLVTMAGAGEARGAAGEASAMLRKTLEAAHVER